MSKTVKAFLILVVLNILFAIIGVATDADGFALFFLLVLSIIISIAILIIVFIVETRKKYLNKDGIGRKKARKTGIIIAITAILILGTGWVILSFNSGYKIPQRDKHKDWSYFPEGSNPDVAIEAIDSMYIYNIKSVKGSDYYFTHFTKDSVQFYDGNIGGQVRFGIMDKEGKLKVEYDKEVTAYIDGERLIVVDITYGNDQPVSCDVYNIKTLELTKEPLNTIRLAEKYDSYSGPYSSGNGKEMYIEKYRTPFFENLEGIKVMEDKPIYPASDKNRGYILFKDKEGKLYTQDYEDSYSLDVLCPQCIGYTLKVSEFASETKAQNITMTETPIVYENILSRGITIGYGSPTGNGTGGIYFKYYQNWLMYYTATIGKTTTSFKVEGGEKDQPYVSFYQLNEVKANTDTLYFIADCKIWKTYRKK